MVAAPILETPSKVAAAALDKLDLTKPISSLTDKLNAAKEFVGAPTPKNEVSRKHKSADEVDELQNDGRDRFVGNPAITCDADEPILKANDKRFVLFPIQYHEVRHSLLTVSSLHAMLTLFSRSTDLGTVQAR